MGSYVESDYLAKLLLPKSQIINTETVDEIKIKSHLGVGGPEIKYEKDENDRIISRVTEEFEKIPYSGLEASWAEMDFIKDYIAPAQQEEKEEKLKPKPKPKSKDIAEEQLVETESREMKLMSEYNYLDPENMDLDYEFGLCDKSTAIYTVHICGFSIDSDGDQPFLKYLFELFGETFGFPHFEFTCPANVGNSASFISRIFESLSEKKTEEVQEADSSENASHVYFLNECLKRIIGIIDVNDHSDPDALKNMYKGFLNNKTDPLNIYAFFDFGDMSLEITEFRRVWGLIDEITNHNKIMGFGIESKILKIFDDNAGLKIILDKEGYKVQIPYVMYLCNMENGEYVNVYNNDDADTVYEERVMHPIFGRYFVFSVTPLNFRGESSIFKIERYAAFTNDPIYFLKDTTDPLFLNPDFDDSMKGEDNESIYFKGVNKLPFWCIKSSDDFTRL